MPGYQSWCATEADICADQQSQKASQGLLSRRISIACPVHAMQTFPDKHVLQDEHGVRPLLHFNAPSALLETLLEGALRNVLEACMTAELHGICSFEGNRGVLFRHMLRVGQFHVYIRHTHCMFPAKRLIYTACLYGRANPTYV
eukprot:1160698-Pelagomonas_calceolata.AAC.2